MYVCIYIGIAAQAIGITQVRDGYNVYVCVFMYFCICVYACMCVWIYIGIATLTIGTAQV